VAWWDVVAVSGGGLALLQSIGLVAGDRFGGAHPLGLASEDVSVCVDACQQVLTDGLVEAVRAEETAYGAALEASDDKDVDSGRNTTSPHSILPPISALICSQSDHYSENK